MGHRQSCTTIPPRPTANKTLQCLGSPCSCRQERDMRVVRGSNKYSGAGRKVGAAKAPRGEDSGNSGWSLLSLFTLFSLFTFFIY
ncbi:hypothetical protein SODALDRAFT_31236 [Sodiomyces alkalinus F11]|uniref:Uncharacterized protein n=1 Tax=Sodiomyces alkalinus (strain CBS 110278 / VKM F-3762 / F11) TaxID=1314773 RepID=A0A3N2Q8Q7_SODAK|nr:hypothetical protein SODALDRAFT_31236 [Sodiomyces alkalinus F11]ROT43120.1 hypothetical protein SODALDRAFT_31236 [Sodiomyces alkalinus F11]